MEKEVNVQEIMTREVVVLHPDQTVDDAAEKMAENEVGSIVLVEDDLPVGILTERDILMRVVAKGKEPEEIKARDIMTSPLMVLRRNDTINDAVELMGKYGIRRIPIVEGGKLIGIIAATDIVKRMPELYDLLEKEVEVAAPKIGRWSRFILGLVLVALATVGISQPMPNIWIKIVVVYCLFVGLYIIYGALRAK